MEADTGSTGDARSLARAHGCCAPPHTLRNSSDGQVKTVTRISPALTSEAFFRDMHSLIQQGKLKRLPPKEPRSAIYAAMLFGKYPEVIRAVKPPNGVFRGRDARPCTNGRNPTPGPYR